MVLVWFDIAFGIERKCSFPVEVASLKFCAFNATTNASS